MEDQRLNDLVRYARSYLYDTGLISDEELAELVDQPTGSVTRLEEYDDLRKRIATLEAQIATQSEDIQRNYPTPLQWQQAQKRIAELAEETAVISKIHGILFTATDNEATADPWWGIVRKAGLGQLNILMGPFFSRDSAEQHRQAREYEYGKKSFVFCFSAHHAHDYRELRDVVRAAIDDARKWT